MMNLILNTDSYKASHYLQYPPGTEYISFYIESRDGGEFQNSIFFGLQAFLKKYLTKPITQANIDEAESFLPAHGLPFNRAGWQRILDQHGGFLPLEIEAMAEGTVIPCSNALVQIVNTDPSCFWLPGYIETALLRAVWYPTTVATISWHCKRIIERYLIETAGSTAGIEFKLHDFGARGASSFETAELGGMAHLLSFKGSDTISGALAAEKYYGGKCTAFSIPAAEHSTITAWGSANEAEAYRHILNTFSGKDRLVAIVSDSYNLWTALEEIWGKHLREQVINNGGTIIIRPDSGKPVEVVTQTVSTLMEKFGSSTNSRGYKVLPPFIRVIQGDGISLESVEAILAAMKALGQSAENVAFGMGGSLLQRCNRDTLRFAMKASAICVAGKWRDIGKTCELDLSKQSKKGRLALIRSGAVGGGAVAFGTVHADGLGNQANWLKKVYRDGKLLVEQSFTEVQERINQSF